VLVSLTGSLGTVPCSDSILLVGEGNFSFARALCRNRQLFTDAREASIAATSATATTTNNTNNTNNSTVTTTVTTTTSTVDDHVEIVDEHSNGSADDSEDVDDDSDADGHVETLHVVEDSAAFRSMQFPVSEEEAARRALDDEDSDDKPLPRAAGGPKRRRPRQGHGRLFATSFDSEAEVRQKYAVAGEIIDELTTVYAPFCTVLHGVDARALHKDQRLKGVRPDHIVFNFPHEGRGVKDESISVNRHRTLLTQFFQSAVDLMRAERCAYTTHVHVTVKRGQPYDKWNVVELARASVTPPLMLVKTFRFEPSLYEGYSHGLTRGDDPAVPDHLADSLCVTYVFAMRDEEAAAAAREAKRRERARANKGSARVKKPKADAAAAAAANLWRARKRTGAQQSRTQKNRPTKQ
jgi:hypothetical protein